MAAIGHWMDDDMATSAMVMRLSLSSPWRKGAVSNLPS